MSAVDEAGTSCWTSEATQQVLNAVPSPKQAQKVIASVLKLEQYRQDARSNILVSLYYQVAQHCAGSGLTVQQAAVLLAVVSRLVERIQSEAWSLDQALAYFTGRMQDLSLGQACVLSVADVRAATLCLTRCFFQSFSLYKYMLTKPRPEHLTETVVFLETAVAPPPLATGQLAGEWQAEQARLAQERADAAEAAAIAAAEQEKQREEAEMKRLIELAAQEDAARAERDRIAEANRIRQEQIKKQLEAEARGERPALTQEAIEEIARGVVAVQLQTLKTTVAEQIELREAALAARIQRLEDLPAGKSRKK